MTTTNTMLPGLDGVAEPSPFAWSPQVHIGDLYRFPDAVAEGMRRELLRLEWAGIAAYAQGRHVQTPQGSFSIMPTGRPTRWGQAVPDFEERARRVAARMADESGFSFNRCFAARFLSPDAQVEPVYASAQRACG